MKPYILILPTILLCVALHPPPLPGQATLQLENPPVEAGFETHRVYVYPPESGGRDLTSRLPGLVFQTMAARVPLIEAYAPEDAHSVIIMDEVKTRIVLSLKDSAGRGTLATVSLDIAGEDLSFTELRELSRRAAEAFLPHTTPVEMDVREADIIAQQRHRRAEELLSFEERLNTPYQTTLWFTQIRNVFDLVEDNFTVSVFSPLFPLSFEIARYSSKGFGFIGGLWLDYNSNVAYYDYLADEEEDYHSGETARGHMTNIIVMPGLGFTYRVLGAVSMDISLLYYAGVVHTTANKRVTSTLDSELGFLDAGESKWFIKHQLTIRPAIVYAMNDRWSLHWSFSISFDPRIPIGGGFDYMPYEGSDTISFCYTRFGVSRRF
ncbi:MAG: hypothetical protein ACLFMZ_08715 [Spirochaetaceae bacterium]